VITDTHAHLFKESFSADLDEVLARAAAASVSRAIVVGTDLATSREAFEVCARSGAGVELFPTAGIHPHDASGADRAALEELRGLCAREACVGVGETGLDYFKMFSPRASQRDAFRMQIELARELDKPLVVHCRDAHEDTVELLRSVPGVRGVMHCYTMGAEELPPYLELGFHISFSGVVTYPKNEKNREAARAVPSDRILFETDCPFLAPQGQRGTRNEPAFVRNVLESVAAVRGVDLETLARASSANAARLFRLSPP
jgi:TatD DNase family protein